MEFLIYFQINHPFNSLIAVLVFMPFTFLLSASRVFVSLRVSIQDYQNFIILTLIFSFLTSTFLTSTFLIFIFLAFIVRFPFIQSNLIQDHPIRFNWWVIFPPTTPHELYIIN